MDDGFAVVAAIVDDVFAVEGAIVDDVFPVAAGIAEDVKYFTGSASCTCGVSSSAQPSSKLPELLSRSHHRERRVKNRVVTDH